MSGQRLPKLANGGCSMTMGEPTYIHWLPQPPVTIGFPFAMREMRWATTICYHLMPAKLDQQFIALPNSFGSAQIVQSVGNDAYGYTGFPCGRMQQEECPPTGVANFLSIFFYAFNDSLFWDKNKKQMFISMPWKSFTSWFSEHDFLLRIEEQATSTGKTRTRSDLPWKALLVGIYTGPRVVLDPVTASYHNYFQKKCEGQRSDSLLMPPLTSKCQCSSGFILKNSHMYIFCGFWLVLWKPLLHFECGERRVSLSHFFHRCLWLGFLDFLILQDASRITKCTSSCFKGDSQRLAIHHGIHSSPIFGLLSTHSLIEESQVFSLRAKWMCKDCPERSECAH